MNQVELDYALRNTSSTPCDLSGVPSVSESHARGDEGRHVHVDATDARESAGLDAYPPVLLSPGQQGSFLAAYGGCEFDPSLSPDNPTTLRADFGAGTVVTIRSSRADQCRDKNIRVSSFAPGLINPGGLSVRGH